MKLYELLKNVRVLENTLDENMEIGFVTSDSRQVVPGCLFVALKGFAVDGNSFIPMALEKGAAVIVTAQKPQQDIPYILVESDRAALAAISTNYYGHPAESMTMIGVTGTNGKSSITWILKHLLEKMTGEKAGLVGTMVNMVGQESQPADRTTPESIQLQALFARMRDAGCKYAVMEVSSHAVALDRIGGVHFDVAAFTNLTPDHMDFHTGMEDYCDAKAELFARCDKAVINTDDPWAGRIMRRCTAPVLTYGLAEGVALKAIDVQTRADGISYTAVMGEQHIPVSVPIPGKFTVYNTLTVLGVMYQLGFDLAEVAQALRQIEGVKGRVEVVPTPGKDYTVLIDYAHTPDGVENILTSVRQFCKGRLIVVFGCGGSRDRKKRPVMGRLAVELADFAVVSTDNPRREDPASIIEEVKTGMTDHDNFVAIVDREKAIHYALDMARKDDIVVLAGRGHETYMDVMGVKHHFDEREIVAAYLADTE